MPVSGIVGFNANKFDVQGFPTVRKRRKPKIDEHKPVCDEDLYDMSLISRRRKPVFWGGLFNKDKRLVKVKFTHLQKLKVFGDSIQNPELILITGSRASQGKRVGKNNFASHLLKHYSCGDRVSFPTIYFSGGNEILLKNGIDRERYKNLINKRKEEWSIRIGEDANILTGGVLSRYRPFNLPNVKIWVPPWKQQDILDTGVQMIFRPDEITPQFLSAVALVKLKGKDTPMYSILSEVLIQKMLEENLDRKGAMSFMDKWIETHKSGYNLSAAYKIIDAITDVYDYLDPDAIPFEEKLLRSNGGFKFNYVINFDGFSDLRKDRLFSEHIAELVIRCNKKYGEKMFPHSNYVPPVLFLDETDEIIPKDAADDNVFLRYIGQHGKHSGPMVILARYPEDIHNKIIDTTSKDCQRGYWTIWFECMPDFQAYQTHKLIKKLSIWDEGKYKRIDSLPEWLQYKLDQSPTLFRFKAHVKPSEVYLPT